MDKATVSVAANYSSLTVTAKARGTATTMVMANDGGTVSDTFTVPVKAALVVAAAISDVYNLEEGKSQDISLSGAFSGADGDVLTIAAASSNQSTLTVAGVAEGTAPITVTA